MMLDIQFITAAIVLFLTLRWLLRKLRVGNYGNKYVFITGCDTGFGNMLAKRLDKLGLHVFAGCLTKQSAQGLKKECSSRLATVMIDVSDDNSIQSAKDEVESKLPTGTGLWAIVNNAGIPGAVAPTEWLSKRDFRRMMDINLLGVIFVTKEFLPLVRRGRGRVVNMASIMGRFAASTTAYSAAKFGVEGFSDQLRRELYRAGIGVHIIEPGYFRTGIVQEADIATSMNAKFKAAPAEVQKYYGQSYLQTVIENSTKVLTLIMSSDVNKVIDAYEHAITARFPRARYVVGWDSQILFRILWNLPEWIGDFIISRGFATPEGAQ